MGTNAFWRPITPKDGKLLSTDIKRKIAKRYMNHDGSLIGKVNLGYDAIGWLEGLRDAGVEDADELIAAIEKHAEIEIFIE